MVRRPEAEGGDMQRTCIPEGGGTAEEQTLWTTNKLKGPISGFAKRKPVAPVPMTPAKGHTMLGQRSSEAGLSWRIE